MIPSDDEAFLREAIRLSYEKMAEGKGGPFGALVVRDGQILGRGWNRVTSKSYRILSPLERHERKTAGT